MKIKEIIQDKGSDVVTIEQTRSVLDAVQVLVDHNIGSLVVMEGERAIGILTERDILRLTAQAPGDLAVIRVGSVMTREVFTTEPNHGLNEAMDIMTERRIRHLPVMEGERVAGIVSIGDLVNACRLLAEQETVHLREYIRGAG